MNKLFNNLILKSALKKVLFLFDDILLFLFQWILKITLNYFKEQSISKKLRNLPK